MPNIGTSKFVSQYFRPELRMYTTTQAELEKSGAKKLDENTYTRTLPNGRIGKKIVYRTDVFTRDGNKFLCHQIPTDEKGYIPDTVMAERLLDVESGDRAGRQRNVFLDIGINAERMHSERDLSQTYRWYIYPNESDVKNIDDSQSMIVTVLGKQDTPGRRSLIIIGGTKEDREKIAFDLVKNFTIRERKIIAGCLIEIQPNCHNYAGCFQGHSDANGKPVGVPKIIIDSKFAKVSDVIIHEAIHALREFDPQRDARLKAVKSYFGRDADLEESLTEAETVTRQNPFEKHLSAAGYYHYITIPKKSKGDLIISDRITLTEQPEKWQESGKRGKRAQKAIIRKYPGTYISKFKLKGNVEAIDTYYEVEKGQGDIVKKQESEHYQFYNPKPQSNTESVLSRQIAAISGKASKFEDGKKIKLQSQHTRIKTRLPSKHAPGTVHQVKVPLSKEWGAPKSIKGVGMTRRRRIGRMIR